MQAKNPASKDRKKKTAVKSGDISNISPKKVRAKYVPDFKIEKLIPYDKNPRINDPAVPEVKKSIMQYGFRDPIEITKDNVIVAGHTRYKAALELKLKTVPVIIHEFDTVQDFIGYNIANNQTATIARWDMKLLSEAVASLKDDDVDLVNSLGFSVGQLDKIAAELADSNFENQIVFENKYYVIVECRDEVHQSEIIEFMIRNKIECRPVTS